MNDYFLTVGLEIHAELSTKTKMFCDSKNDTNELRPNINVCPVCLGYPGTLPVINKEAVLKVLCLGVAVGGEIADFTEFDRKNYFYPDIPKGYQISQYKHPLVKGGELAGVKLTRIHLEEDTAKSIHNDKEESLLDFNRAGVPLMELVTEPVIKSAEVAANFARELQLLLRYLDISGANMEKGEMRVEANVSVAKVRPSDSEFLRSDLGTKVEVKNLNSFKIVEKAIKFETKRQIEILEKGERVIQETRGRDENKEVTFSQRLKESAHDYRYFPDPDLPKLFIKQIPEFDENILRASLPELPWQKRERLIKLGITPEHAEIYVTNPKKDKEFHFFSSLSNNPKFIQAGSNYIINEIKRPMQASSVLGVVEMVEEGSLSSKGAKEIFRLIPKQETDSRKFAEEKNLIQISDKKVLKQFVEEVLKENTNAPIQFLVGQAMKKSEGRANPVMLQELLLEMLNR